LAEVLPPLAQVLVVPDHHVRRGVPEELGHLDDADALFEGIGRERVAEGVADDALQMGKLLPEPPEPAADAVSREGPAAPTDDELDRTFADLNSEEFTTRDRASRRLAELGELAVPGVRQRLDRTESAEVRKRVLAFLGRFEPAPLWPDRLRQLRGVELLEGIGTSAARDVLSELAKGSAEAPLRREAAAALERLRRR
jgi:hypothetical protein